jgi:hypothetical protein
VTPLRLHLRARRVPSTAAALVVATAVMWSLRLVYDNPAYHTALAILATALGVALVAPGLSGADDDLERAGAVRWPLWRAAHLAVATVVVTGAVIATGLTGEPMAHSGLVLRHVVGMMGLLALGAVVLGTNWAWLPVLACATVAMFTGGITGPWYKELASWAAQPLDAAPAAVTAVVVAVGGSAAYSMLGVRGRR